MNGREVIIELGAEGGSIALYGFRTDRGWLFTREVIDQTPELIDEERIEKTSSRVEVLGSGVEASGSISMVQPLPDLSPSGVRAANLVRGARATPRGRRVPKSSSGAGASYVVGESRAPTK